MVSGAGATGLLWSSLHPPASQQARAKRGLFPDLDPRSLVRSFPSAPAHFLSQSHPASCPGGEFRSPPFAFLRAGVFRALVPKGRREGRDEVTRSQTAISCPPEISGMCFDDAAGDPFSSMLSRAAASEFRPQGGGREGVGAAVALLWRRSGDVRSASEVTLTLAARRAPLIHPPLPPPPHSHDVFDCGKVHSTFPHRRLSPSPLPSLSLSLPLQWKESGVVTGWTFRGRSLFARIFWGSQDQHQLQWSSPPPPHCGHILAVAAAGTGDASLSLSPSLSLLTSISSPLQSLERNLPFPPLLRRPPTGR